MQKIAKDLQNDIRAAKKMRLTWRGLLGVGAATFFLAWFADDSGHPKLTLPAVNAAAVLAFVIAVKPKLRGELWFWIFMGFVAALHIVLLLVVPWTTKWVPASAIAFIDSIDLLGILAALSVVSNAVDSSD